MMKALLLALITLSFSFANARTCEDAYKKLYKKGRVDFRVVFGYKDARPARFVGDRHERVAFIQRILRECEGDEQVCGFERSEENSDLFTKTIVGPYKKPVLVRLIVVNSSVGSDDETNRANDHQAWQSVYAKSAFLSGLEKADVVLYNGHSRFGGGPDFNPPKMDKNGEVDPSRYQGKSESFNNARLALRKRSKNSKEGLKVLGLFSCASTEHFSEGLRTDSKAGVITSRVLIYYADALESSLGALKGLLEMKCEKEFQSGLRPRGMRSGAHIEGFF